jgi:vacuolar-type H+-ATPase subunit H
MALNEKKIQAVIEIEKQASEVYDKAVKDADRIPVQAEKDAQELVEKARTEAEAEAQRLLASAQPKDQCEKILADSEKQIKHNEAVAKQNFERAVTYVISRVLGRE